MIKTHELASDQINQLTDEELVGRLQFSNDPLLRALGERIENLNDYIIVMQDDLDDCQTEIDTQTLINR